MGTWWRKSTAWSLSLRLQVLRSRTLRAMIWAGEVQSGLPQPNVVSGVLQMPSAAGRNYGHDGPCLVLGLVMAMAMSRCMQADLCGAGVCARWCQLLNIAARHPVSSNVQRVVNLNTKPKHACMSCRGHEALLKHRLYHCCSA